MEPVLFPPSGPALRKARVVKGENRIGRAWLKKKKEREKILKITSGVELDDARLLRLKSLKEEFVG